MLLSRRSLCALDVELTDLPGKGEFSLPGIGIGDESLVDGRVVSLGVVEDLVETVDSSLKLLSLAAGILSNSTVDTSCPCLAVVVLSVDVMVSLVRALVVRSRSTRGDVEVRVMGLGGRDVLAWASLLVTFNDEEERSILIVSVVTSLLAVTEGEASMVGSRALLLTGRRRERIGLGGSELGFPASRVVFRVSQSIGMRMMTTSMSNPLNPLSIGPMLDGALVVLLVMDEKGKDEGSFDLSEEGVACSLVG